MSMRNLAGRIVAERLDRFNAGSDAIVDGLTLSGERTAAATPHRARDADSHGVGERRRLHQKLRFSMEWFVLR